MKTLKAVDAGARSSSDKARNSSRTFWSKNCRTISMVSTRRTAVLFETDMLKSNLHQKKLPDDPVGLKDMEDLADYKRIVIAIGKKRLYACLNIVKMSDNT